MKTVSEIKALLAQFNEIKQTHLWSSLFPDFISDGVLCLAREAECFWLLDAIASWQHQAVLTERHQVWHLDVVGHHAATLVATDASGRVIARQLFGFTDFPMDQITLIAMRPNDYAPVVISLPSER